MELLKMPDCFDCWIVLCPGIYKVLFDPDTLPMFLSSSCSSEVWLSSLESILPDDLLLLPDSLTKRTI